MKVNNKKIENPQIHKFTSIETLFKILKPDCGFRFSSLKDLNDVFESADIKESNVLRYRTLSFTRCLSSTLMWGHYGKGYQGCCIKLNKNKYTCIDFQQVVYVSRKERCKKSDLDKMLIKGDKWFYEKEHRIIVNIDDKLNDDVFQKGKYYFLKPYIKAVYLGPNVKDSKEYLEVLKILKRMNDLSKEERRYVRDKIDVNKYKIAEDRYELIVDNNYDYKKEIVRLEDVESKLEWLDKSNNTGIETKRS